MALAPGTAPMKTRFHSPAVGDAHHAVRNRAGLKANSHFEGKTALFSAGGADCQAVRHRVREAPWRCPYALGLPSKLLVGASRLAEPLTSLSVRCLTRFVPFLPAEK
jgi:hypothetical protein